jgi:hypothetical protein
MSAENQTLSVSDEQRQRILRAARNLVESGRRREQRLSNITPSEEEEESESESENDIEDLDPSQQDLLNHLESFEQKKRQTSALNKQKKEDRNTLIEALEDADVTSMTLGQYVISLKEKKTSNISSSNLKKIPGLTNEALGKILTWMSEHPTQELKVKKKRGAKRENEGDANTTETQRQRTTEI